MYNNCILKGNVILMPNQTNSNTVYNLLKACEIKYNNSLTRVNDKIAIIVAVKNIKIDTISSKILRESNASAARFFFDMVVNLIHVKENDVICCNITGINSDFIEAIIMKTKRITIFIIVENAIDETNDNIFELRDREIIVKSTNKPLQIGDVLKVRCDEIVQPMKDLVIISHILDNIV